MTPPTAKFGNAILVAWAATDGIDKTDACVFHRAGELQTSFAALAIARYPNSSGYYLFLCDQHWRTLNDLFHESVAEAKSAAERLYPGISARWQPSLAE